MSPNFYELTIQHNDLEVIQTMNVALHLILS